MDHAKQQYFEKLKWTKINSPGIVSIIYKSLTYGIGSYNPREETLFQLMPGTQINSGDYTFKQHHHRKITMNQNKISYFWNGDSLLN